MYCGCVDVAHTANALNGRDPSQVGSTYDSRLFLLTAAGVETIHPVGSMSDYEKEIMTAMQPELLASIEKGIKFVKEN